MADSSSNMSSSSSNANASDSSSTSSALSLAPSFLSRLMTWRSRLIAQRRLQEFGVGIGKMFSSSSTPQYHRRRESSHLTSDSLIREVQETWEDLQSSLSGHHSDEIEIAEILFLARSCHALCQLIFDRLVSYLLTLAEHRAHWDNRRDEPFAHFLEFGPMECSRSILFDWAGIQRWFPESSSIGAYLRSSADPAHRPVSDLDTRLGMVRVLESFLSSNLARLRLSMDALSQLSSSDPKDLKQAVAFTLRGLSTFLDSCDEMDPLKMLEQSLSRKREEQRRKHDNSSGGGSNSNSSGSHNKDSHHRKHGSSSGNNSGNNSGSKDDSSQEDDDDLFMDMAPFSMTPSRPMSDPVSRPSPPPKEQHISNSNLSQDAEAEEEDADAVFDEDEEQSSQQQGASASSSSSSFSMGDSLAHPGLASWSAAATSSSASPASVMAPMSSSPSHSILKKEKGDDASTLSTPHHSRQPSSWSQKHQTSHKKQATFSPSSDVPSSSSVSSASAASSPDPASSAFSSLLSPPSNAQPVTESNSQLYSLLYKCISSVSPMMEEQIGRKALASTKPPSKLRRNWLPYSTCLFGTGAISYWLTMGGGREKIPEWSLAVHESAARFFDEHLREPAHNIWDVVVRNHHMSVADEEEHRQARESLRRMLLDIGNDLQHRGLSIGKGKETAIADGGAGESQVVRIETLEDRASRLDMSIFAQEFEKELRNPVRNIAAGELVRMMLLQVQRLKVDLLGAMTELDQILRANQLNFDILATIPAAVLLIGGAAWIFGTRQRRAKKRLEVAKRAITERLRVVERLLNRYQEDPLALQAAAAQQVNNNNNGQQQQQSSNSIMAAFMAAPGGRRFAGLRLSDHGRVMMEVLRMEKESLDIPRREQKPFLEDVRELESGMSVRQKLRTVDRMYRTFSFLQNQHEDKKWF